MARISILALAEQYLAFIEAARKRGENTMPRKLAAELDLLAEELRLAQNALSEITGEFTSDDLLGKIFSSFCIGK